MKSLFQQDLNVVNVGLQGFADNAAAAGAKVTHLNWAPPAGADAKLGWSLACLVGDKRIEEANRIAYARYLAALPRLVDLVLAKEAIAGLGGGERRILHAGPPIDWADMCGPQQGAISGAILYEGWADSLEAAEKMAATGKVALEPCHAHGAVGPMAGIISPSMPVWVVENTDRGNRTYSNLNEGLGKVLRFGANSPDIIERLRWLGSEFFTTMQTAVRGLADANLKPLMAQALHMGDELHNRNAAASGLLFKRLTLSLLGSKLDSGVIERSLRFVAGNDHFFLNISMAACKSMSDAAHGVPGSSMVTVMARNGVNFGIRLSGTGDRWFQAPASPVNGLYFPGYSVADAAADLGDSAITEVNGLGGFAMAASPAIVQFVGGTPAEATANSRRMLGITLGSNPAFTLPPLNFGGTPAGIDARLVADSGVLPIINTGIAHRKAGIGQIGAGITTAPMECFAKAIAALWADLGAVPAAKGGKVAAPGAKAAGDAAPAPVLLAVNGTLMRGLKLSPNMAAAGATFVREAVTEPAYRFWAINDDHPAMIRMTDGSGSAIQLEVWSVPAAGLAAILLAEPPGLCIGKVNLADGSTVLGVLGENALVEGQSEITAHGGWRAYIKSKGKA